VNTLSQLVLYQFVRSGMLSAECHLVCVRSASR